RSPGQLPRHYAPKTPLEVTRDSRRRVEELCAKGLRVGWLTHVDDGKNEAVKLVLPADASGYAAGLYAALHQLDAAGLDVIVVESPQEGERWLAINDRLRRAATQIANSQSESI